MALTVAFLHTGQPVDVDNMLKPVMDALTGLAYDDDHRLEQVTGLRHDLSAGFEVSAVSPVLAVALVQALVGGAPFVYLRLRPPADVKELLQ